MQCQLACLAENPIHAKHATGYRDYRHRTVIYYTPWRCVSSPSDFAIVLADYDQRMVAFAKSSMPAIIGGDEVIWRLMAYNYGKKND